MTSSNNKRITIEYYEVRSYVDVNKKKNTGTLARCDISGLLNRLQGLDVKGRTVEYNGENLILSEINYNENTELWELVFFKSRSFTVPFIVNKDGKKRKIQLKNGEMISEVLCVEYNPKLRVIAMQRNVYACGTKGLEMFFSKLAKKMISLASIQMINEERKLFFRKSIVKKFRLHIKNVGKGSNTISPYNKGTTICKVIDAAVAMNSTIINIEFSVGNSSKKIDMKKEDFEVLEDLMGNNNVKCMELGFAPDEKATMQITDFMDIRVKDEISVPSIKGQPIDITEILSQMTIKFNNNEYIKGD